MSARPGKRFKYALTYESDVNPPLTITGEISCALSYQIWRLAAKDARSKAKGKKVYWRSAVLLVEKLDEEPISNNGL